MKRFVDTYIVLLTRVRVCWGITTDVSPSRWHRVLLTLSSDRPICLDKRKSLSATRRFSIDGDATLGVRVLDHFPNPRQARVNNLLRGSWFRAPATGHVWLMTSEGCRWRRREGRHGLMTSRRCAETRGRGINNASNKHEGVHSRDKCSPQPERALVCGNSCGMRVRASAEMP